MTNMDFGGSIPERYDEDLGPLFLQHYAKELAGRLAVPEGARVLELACGTGIATEHLRRALAIGVELVATDLNDGMMDYARAKRGALPNVRFDKADALALPYDDDAFDAVVCQFGIMFFPDKSAGMREAFRVLRPGGTFLFSVWDSLERNPVAKLGREILARFFDADPPGFVELPFGYHALDPIKGSLQESGFGEIRIHVLPATVECPSARRAAIGFVTGNPGIHEIHARANAPAERIIEAVAEGFAQAYGDAPMRASLQAIVFEAQKL